MIFHIDREEEAEDKEEGGGMGRRGEPLPEDQIRRNGCGGGEVIHGKYYGHKRFWCVNGDTSGVQGSFHNFPVGTVSHQKDPHQEGK